MAYHYLCVNATVLSDNFLKYMEAFKPFFAAGLKNIEEYQVCCEVYFTVVDMQRCCLATFQNTIYQHLATTTTCIHRGP